MNKFPDASELGYGKCSYIRMVNEIGRVHCSLFLGRSRSRIPIWMLNAAVLSVKMVCLIEKRIEAWGDTEMVLDRQQSSYRLHQE